MSSPANDDGDRRANRMPAWARDEPSFDTGRRLQDEIAAEVQRLNPARVTPLPDAHFQPRHEDSGAAARKAGSPTRPYNPEDPRRAPRRMQPNGPTPVQPPPRVEAPGSRWGLTARLAGAAVLAIVVTVFVMRSPWFASGDRSVPFDTKDTGKEASAAGPLVAAAQENTRQVVAAVQENTRQVVAPAQENTRQFVAAPQENPKQPPAPPAVNNAPERQQSAGLSPVAERQDRGERTFALARQTPVQQRPDAQQNNAEKLPPSAVPEPRVLDFLSAEEIEILLKRGQDLIATGDISGGRLLLTRAAEAGDARASLALAGTYDAAVLATLGVVGVSADTAKARAWYSRAAEQGSAEAARRLRQLAAQ